MPATSNQLLVHFAGQLDEFCRLSIALTEAAVGLADSFASGTIATAAGSMAPGDTFGDTQATLTQALAVKARYEAVIAANQNGNIANHRALVAFHDAFRAKAPEA